MKPFALAVLLGLTIWVGAKGADTTPRRRAEQALLQIHEKELQAHRQTDWRSLLVNAQDGFVYVRDGEISRSNVADARANFAKYFKNAKYQVYEDIAPPLVRASEDGTMGWVISRTHAKRSQTDPATGKEEREEFVYAGIMTYELKDGRWFRVANVSTFEPQPK